MRIWQVKWFTVVLTLTMTSVGQAADWPTYLHDDSRCGATDEQLSLPLAPKWIYSSADQLQLAWEGPRAEPFEGLYMRHRMAFDNVLHAVIADGLAFFGSTVDNKVYAVELDSGEIRWEFFTDGAVRLAPTWADGRLYVGSDDGVVYCLQANSGQLVWKLRAGPGPKMLLARGRMVSRWPIRTGVVVRDGVAYFGAGVFPHETVFLYAVDALDGKVLWKNDTISQQDAGRNPLSPQGYLLCSESRLFVPSGRALPVGFDRETGKQLFQRSHPWRSTAGGVVGGSKALLADGQIYTSGPHHFLAMNQEDGTVGFAWVTGRQMVIGGDRAFVADGTRVVALDRLKHAKATIRRQKLQMEIRSVRANRSKMDATEYNQKLRDLQAQVKELSDVGVLWQVPCSDDAALVLAGNVLFAGGEGQVTGWDVERGQQIWQAKVEGQVGGLAVGNGRLLASTTQGKIYCFAAAAGDSESPRQVTSPKDGELFVDDPQQEIYAQTAEQILDQTGVRRGFCLVLGSGEGRLAYELAKRSDLQIYGIEADEELARKSRIALDQAGWHGRRVTILHGDPAATPFSNYFANLVVSEQHLNTGELPCSSHELARHIKPCGGVLCLAVPQAAGVPAATDRWQTTRETVTRARQQINCDVQQSDALLTLVRGKPPGAGDWTHQYGDAANTMMSKDELVRGDLGVLWYGDPGPAKMVNRHDAAAAPLSTNGRMFIQGYKSVMAYDAFNGVFLWERKNPGAVRTGVFGNEDTANLAASEDFLFVVVDNQCSVLDAATGDLVAEYKTEAESSDDVKRVWGYVAHWNGMLFGTSTVRSELDRSLRRRGLQVKKATDAIFAINLETGKRQWTYRGGNIEHVTIAIGDDRVFFIDSSISPEQRQTLLRQDKSELQNLSSEEAAKKEAELKSLDVRLAVALDASTGEKLWSRAVDVTDCSEIGIGGGKLTLMYHDGHVVLGGANANGHYWRQFLSGQFNRRRLVVLDANHGDLLWSKDANYRHRPIIVGDEIIAEPWGFDLHTGKQKTRENPVTGEETAWQFSRPGHHCGPITATPNMLVFRSGFTAYYDLYGDSGTSHFAGQRPGCWVNAIPGNGLLMVPEASAGCVCLFSLAATVVMEPRTDHDTWRIYSATGGSTPVRHLAVNFGAPGDRKDAQGTLWLAYPRPRLVGRLEYDLNLKCQHQSSGGYFQQNDQLVEVDSAETPWVFTSGLQQATRCEIPLLGKDDDPAEYRVKLLFTVAPEQNEHAGNARILIQGQPQTVAASAAEDGTYRSQEYQGISVQDRLVIEFSAADPADSASLPTLAGVEITRE